MVFNSVGVITFVLLLVLVACGLNNVSGSSAELINCFNRCTFDNEDLQSACVAGCHYTDVSTRCITIYDVDVCTNCGINYNWYYRDNTCFDDGTAPNNCANTADVYVYIKDNCGNAETSYSLTPDSATQTLDFEGSQLCIDGNADHCGSITIELWDYDGWFNNDDYMLGFTIPKHFDTNTNYHDKNQTEDGIKFKYSIQ